MTNARTRSPIRRRAQQSNNAFAVLSEAPATFADPFNNRDGPAVDTATTGPRHLGRSELPRCQRQ